MNKFYIAHTLSLILLFSSCASTPSGSSFFSDSSVPTIKLREYKEVLLQNGLKIYFIQDQSLPRMSLNLLIKTGLPQETIPGQNFITAELLESGTQKRNATQLAEAFGNLGSNLNITPGADFTVISADSLSSSAEDLLQIFSEVVQKPSFQEVEIERERSQILAQISKKKDNPSGLVDDLFDENLFIGHPYANDILGSAESVRSLRKKDIIQHYLNWYRPNNSELAVVGSFDEEFEKKVAAQFDGWIKKNINASSKSQAAAQSAGQTVAYLRDHLEQTQIRMGLRGIKRNNPDFLAVRLANEILGGGFGSRLNQKVRDDLGLTYSIHSSVDARLEPGAFLISTFTKNDSVEKTIVESKKVFDEYVQNGPTDQEIRAAKNQLTGQFPRAIETADRFAFNLLALSFYGIPKTYLSEFNKNVEKISREDVNKVLRSYFKTENLTTVIYGDKKIETQLASLKPVIKKM